MNDVYLSIGNDKIYQSYIFNLPTKITCPGATKMCKAVCYSRPQEYLYPQCKPCRMRNLELSKREDFSELLLDKLKNAKFRRLRIHESGDFYNQTYLDKWVKVIRARPDIKFWVYTKSYKLDFTKAKKLHNFHLRLSGDATSSKGAWDINLPKGVLSSKPIKDLFICPSSKVKGHAIRCMKDCYFCIENNRSLMFLPHGTFKNKVREFEAGACNYFKKEVTCG